ncbi:nucleolar protein 12 [Mercurialis annua]|uniref:nucleolar protein 12 n=1 Tax=Mercurialis annua TaxID=3986 RepID=UPI00216080CB|nr:nucleolar protein 12 [Mercurialis annua]
MASNNTIFNTLFGDADQNSAAISSALFSDNNPFKRKSEEPHDSIPQEPEVKVTKSNQKPKKLKPQKADPIEELSNGKKKKKKRKRDDVEGDYEAKKYGSVPELADGNNNVVHPPPVVGEKRKKAENVEEDLLVSKDAEGFDDESKLLRTVFVGNLPLKLKKKALMKEFTQFGEIESVRIRSVPIMDTKIPRKGAVILKKINDSADSVHAYIVFNTEQSAEAALVHNMSVVGGNHIRVDRACPPRKKLKGDSIPLYDSKRTIFVGNLPFDVKDEEIYQLFCSIKDLNGSIEAVRVIRDTHLGLGKGIAYVLLKTREAANLVLRKKNLKIRERELRLSYAKKDSTSTPLKRKHAFSAEKAGMPNKKSSMESRTPDRKNWSNSKASLSYQGLRASKSGSEKKLYPKNSGAGKRKLNGQTGEKQRQEKRPAVAARNAKAKARDGSAVKHGHKRKMDGRTPGSSNMEKKTKRFRK